MSREYLFSKLFPEIYSGPVPDMAEYRPSPEEARKLSLEMIKSSGELCALIHPQDYKERIARGELDAKLADRLSMGEFTDKISIEQARKIAMRAAIGENRKGKVRRRLITLLPRRG